MIRYSNIGTRNMKIFKHMSLCKKYVLCLESLSLLCTVDLFCREKLHALILNLSWNYSVSNYQIWQQVQLSSAHDRYTNPISVHCLPFMLFLQVTMGIVMFEGMLCYIEC